MPRRPDADRQTPARRPHIASSSTYHPDVAWNTTQVDGTSSAPRLTRAFRRYPPGAGLLAIVEQKNTIYIVIDPTGSAAACVSSHPST